MKLAVNNNQKNEKFNFIFEGTSYIQKIEEKIKDELNNFCVECGEENPEYISINNGIFLCGDCVQNHLKFPKSISIIRKNNIKSLTLNEIQFLLCGGNRSLLNFICNEYPKLAELSPNILYRTQAMVYYRQNLEYLINGSIPPIKPSIKIAYNIPNFLNDIDTNSTDNVNNDCDYDDIKDFKDLMKKYDKGNGNNNNFKENNYILNGSGNEYEDDNFFEENNKFYKTGFNFRQSRNNQKSLCNTESNKFNNKFTISNNTNTNTIGNDSIYDNFYINNRLKRINNKKILYENKLKFTDNNNTENGGNDNNLYQHFPQRIKINLNKSKKGKIKTKINNSNKNMSNTNSIPNHKNKNFNYNISNYLRNSVNNDIYRKPKLLLYHNGSQSYLNIQRTINQRSNSYEKINKNYFYSLPNMISKKSKIDSIQLDFSKDVKNEIIRKKRNMIKNLSHEMYKNNKKFMKGNKNIHKSFSQKMFNNIGKNKNKRNKNILINNIENDFYIPEKKSKFNFYFSNSNSKSKIDINSNKMTISNIEEIQILPSRNKTINNNKINNMNTIASSEKYSTEENLNLKNLNNNINKDEFNTLPIKISIKVKKKEFIDNNDKKEKEKEKIKQFQDNLNLNKKKEKPKENIYYTTKSKLFQLKKSGTLKKYVIKNNNNKNRILLRQKQKNKININSNNSMNMNKEIIKTFSQKNFSDNFYKYNTNKNKNEKNNINTHMNSNSIRSRHKVGFQFK